MPGTTLMLTANPHLCDQTAFDTAQSLMKHHKDYETYRTTHGGLCVGHVAYPGYPIREIAEGPCWIRLEGRVYSHSHTEVDIALRNLAECFVLNAGDEALAKQVAAWIQRADGEFVVVLADPQKQRVAVFSDVLGRLPLYSYADEERLLVARECKFLQAMKPAREFDAIGCAQLLWLCYTLGSRTLLKDVQREPGASYLWAEASGDKIRCVRKSLFSMNFQIKASPNSLKQEAREVAELFIAACARRGQHPDVETHIVSLSGGQDSRAVAAGYLRAGVPFQARTYVRKTERAQNDARMAEKISRTLGVDWSLLTMTDGNPEMEQELVWMKDELNYSAMAFILEYCRGVLNEFGRSSVCVSGDGGDKVLPDLRPATRFSNEDELVAFLVRKSGTGFMQDAAALAGVEVHEIMDDVRGVLSTYPEYDLTQKAIHFTVYEQ